MTLKQQGRVPLPADLPPSLQNLVRALLVVETPNRLGYEGVQGWLRGETLVIPKTTLARDYPPLVFGWADGEDRIAHDPAELADLMERYPEQGCRLLYKGQVGKWLEPVDSGLYSLVETTREDDYPRDQMAGLQKVIYLLDRTRELRGLDRQPLSTYDEIARELESNFDHYADALARDTAELYLYLEARDQKDRADAYRKVFKHQTANAGPAAATAKEAALNFIILELQGGEYVGDGFVLQQPEGILTQSVEVRVELAALLANKSSKFSLWLSQRPELDQYIESWRRKDRQDADTLRHAVGYGPVADGRDITTVAEVRQLLAQDPHAALRAAPELEHWLSLYQHIELAELARERLEHAPVSDALALVTLIARGADRLGLEPFEFAREIMARMRGGIDDPKRLARALAPSFERWLNSARREAPRFVDRLHILSEQLVQHAKQDAAFWGVLVRELESAIPAGVRQDIGSRNEEPEWVQSVLEQRDAAIAQLAPIVPGLVLPQQIAAEERQARSERGDIRAQVELDHAKAKEAAVAAHQSRVEVLRAQIAQSNREQLLERRLHSTWWIAFAILAASTPFWLEGIPLWTALKSNYAWLTVLGIALLQVVTSREKLKEIPITAMGWAIPIYGGIILFKLLLRINAIPVVAVVAATWGIGRLSAAQIAAVWRIRSATINPEIRQQHRTEMERIEKDRTRLTERRFWHRRAELACQYELRNEEAR